MKVVEVKNKDGKLLGRAVRCPACEADDVGSVHIFFTEMPDGGGGWHFNGNMESPTFSPSMLARGQWGPERRPHVCHSYVRDGKIEYLSDCTHKMAGQTIELPEFDRD